MTFTLAQHSGTSRSRRVDRTLHIGALVCFGTFRSSSRTPVRELRPADLPNAVRMIQDDILDIWRPFTIHADRSEFRYQFAIEVVASPTRAPVQTIAMNDDVSDVAEREGLFRDARSALVEADGFGLENIAVIAPYLSSVPHGQTVWATMGVAPPDADRPARHAQLDRLRASGGVQERTSNAIVLEYARDIESRTHTPAHETGHLLGLTNASELGSIMGPNRDETQARGRRVTREDQRLLHAVIEGSIPGLVRPGDAQTSGRQTPHRFDGVYSRAAP